ncbi:antitoxin, Phd family protein [Pseudomonas weihenstephanensis]|uniref:Antitoxin n=1 Tax=Pseudomonas weihenstephanensis TaxID=1608994 RepID=A0A0J6IUV5_9PSED|nr:type II toxin-antitoxin system Phd/YefM family antitoxin [Pseudomonas weihenstephanensis]KMN15944.1 antitoxin, Phd family protein [Pseudomonas weihenstephanensis]
MSLATHIRPITYLKNSAADIVKEFTVNPEPIIITQNGEPKMVIVEINDFERQQETMALLKLIALGHKQVADGKFSDAMEFIEELGD